MKTTWILTSFFISSVSLAVSTNATTMDSETVESNTVRYGSNSNDRFNNLDNRSNSMSSPSHYGAEQRVLGEPENTSRMTGGSSGDPANYDWEREAGNPTTDWESGRAMSPSDANRATGSSTYHEKSVDRTPSNTMDRNRAADMDANTNMNRSTGGSSDTAAGAAAAGSAANTGMTAQDTATRTQSETELVRRIRSEITSSSDLSIRAHNVKIINQNGQIYLKGPVANTMEKSKVEEIAKRMAGNTNVVNQTYVEKK